MLAKTLGVEKLVIAINKMDDPSVEWAQSRYDEIQKLMSPFMKTQGFKKDEFLFLPISGLTGDNVKERKKTPAWFSVFAMFGFLVRSVVGQERGFRNEIFPSKNYIFNQMSNFQ